MEHSITHSCGHEQIHYLAGFTSQQERKARWLRTTNCRRCFIAEKQTAQAEAAARDGAAIAHLNLPPLAGSDRQVAWATTIRAGRLGALMAEPLAADASGCEICLPITDAKWWIDHRTLTDADLLEGCALRRRGQHAGGPHLDICPSTRSGLTSISFWYRQKHELRAGFIPAGHHVPV